MNNKFDVIVVGCGPAGAQAAKNISKNGKSVLVLDHREEIGNKLCTGIVGSELINKNEASMLLNISDELRPPLRGNAFE